MKSLEFIYSWLDGDIFFIKKQEKNSNLKYGVIRLIKINLIALIECIKITNFGRPVPIHLQKYLEGDLLPRFLEIKEFLETEDRFSKEFGIEISNANQDDLLYKLNIARIKNILKDRGYHPLQLIDLIAFIQLIQYTSE